MGQSTGSAYTKLSNPASRYAIVGAAVVISLKGSRCQWASVALGGVTPTVLRAPSVEATLVGQELGEERISAAANAVKDDLGDDILSDIHASADYRRQMAVVFVKRAVTKAFERAS
jgi:carbon-monoxide dehydrogenase medium subunit